MNDSASPLVSVVIPTYNHAHYLGRALQSLIDQTMDNWEAIVIDNHSTDKTDEVMVRFSDPRITYCKIYNNGIIAASRNYGICRARGEWVAFLDSDDWWTVDKLKTCFDHINENTDFVYHDLAIVNGQSGLFKRKKLKCWQVKMPVLIDLMVRGNAIATSSVMVRKKFLNQVKGMNESADLVAAEDYHTWLRIAELTDNYYYIKKVLGKYFVNKQSMSQKDMSIPTRNAVSKSTYLLNKYQKNLVESLLRFTSIKYQIKFKKGSMSNADLFFLLKNGDFIIKIKTLCFYFICNIKAN